jgi:hypothetical protein
MMGNSEIDTDALLVYSALNNIKIIVEEVYDRADSKYTALATLFAALYAQYGADVPGEVKVITSNIINYYSKEAQQ